MSTLSSFFFPFFSLYVILTTAMNDKMSCTSVHRFRSFSRDHLPQPIDLRRTARGFGFRPRRSFSCQVPRAQRVNPADNSRESSQRLDDGDGCATSRRVNGVTARLHTRMHPGCRPLKGVTKFKPPRASVVPQICTPVRRPRARVVL